MPKITASFIHAGGEGKTAVLGSLAAELALRGRRVALLDFDPQGTLTALFGYSFEAIDPKRDTILGYLEDGKPRPPKAPEAFEGRLHLWPAHLAMEGLNYHLHADFAEANAFSDFLRQLAESGEYDHVLVDLPPSSNAITKLTLLSAHGTLIPATPTPKGAYGVQQALQLIARAQQQAHRWGRGYPKVALAVVNKIERTALHSRYTEAIEKLMREYRIPVVRLQNRPGLYADAAALGMPLPLLLRNSRQAAKDLGRRHKPEALEAAREEVGRLAETFLAREGEL